MFINCPSVSIDIKLIDTEIIKTEPIAFYDFSWSETKTSV